MRPLLPTILLVLALGACSERFDTDQQRVCRQAIPALNAPGTPITIERSGTGSHPHILRMIYLAGPAEGPVRRRSIDCLFAGEGQGARRGALIGLASGSSSGVSSVLIYMAIYIVMTIGTFAIILMMRRRGGMTENISDLAGLSRTNMPMALILTVLLFSLAGVPPTAGFFGKWYVFLAAVDAGLIWLAVLGVFASAVSAFYYLRVVWFMWFDDPAPAFERDKGPALAIAAWGSALLMFPVLTVAMGYLRQLAESAAASLF